MPSSLQDSIDDLLGLHSLGRYADMEARARAALNRSPAPPSCASSLASRLPPSAASPTRCHILSVQPAPAEQSLRRSLALQPGSIEALVALGRVLYLLRRHEEAREALERVLTLALGHPAAHYHLGEVLTGLDQLDQAEEHLALRLRPSPTSLRPTMRSHAAWRACDWDFAARLEPQACRIAEVAGPVDESAPWRLLFLAGASAAQQLATARRSAQRIADTLPHQVSVSRTAMRERIRIGFFSGDF